MTKANELKNDVMRNTILTVQDAIGELEEHCQCLSIDRPDERPCDVCLDIRALYAAMDCLDGVGVQP